MARWNRALVTGASSGIGKAIAEQLADDGTALVLVARDGDRLSALADRLPTECEVLTADLADPVALATVEARITGLTNETSPVDLVVNNAGLGYLGPFHELDVDRESAVMAVNVHAVHRLSHAAASALVARGHGGGILNVSSMAAWLPMPNSATYAASKAFVNSMSESLRGELEPHGVHVTALCPGYTRTEFQDRAGFDSSQVPDVLWQTATEVAAAGLTGVAANRAIVVPGTKNRIGAGLISALPGPLRRLLLPKLADESLVSDPAAGSPRT